MDASEFLDILRQTLYSQFVVNFFFFISGLNLGFMIFGKKTYKVVIREGKEGGLR